MESTTESELWPSLFTPMNLLLYHPEVRWENEGGGVFGSDAIFGIYTHSAAPPKAPWLQQTQLPWLPAHVVQITNYSLFCLFVCRKTFEPIFVLLLLFCIFFQSIHFNPSSQREKRNTLMQILNSHHEEKTSVPKALLILAQISIACKELLTSLKQAILIKARIINSDLRTTWALKVEERFWSRRSRELEAGGRRQMRVRVWVISNNLQSCQEFSKECQVHRAVHFILRAACFSWSDVFLVLYQTDLHLWKTPPALHLSRHTWFLFIVCLVVFAMTAKLQLAIFIFAHSL